MSIIKYRSIYDDLKKKIEDGTYSYLEVLPSENFLCEHYGTARNTVRRALSLLSKKGYIQSVHGKGSHVVYYQPMRSMYSMGEIESFEETASRSNLNIKTNVLIFDEKIVDEECAAFTHFPLGVEIFYIVRTRCFNGETLIIDHNYFLKSVVGSLTPELATQSIYSYLEKKRKVRIDVSLRNIYAERANEFDLQHIDGIAELPCVLVVVNQTRDSFGNLFECTISRHRYDAFSFQDVATRLGEM